MTLAAAAACTMEMKRSPPPTVKRHMNSGHNWREFIEREHDTVDNLIQDSFANYCKNLNQAQAQPQHPAMNFRVRKGSFGTPGKDSRSSGYGGSLARSSRKSASPPKQQQQSSSSVLSHLTMPRRSPPKASKTLMDEFNDANQQLAELIRDDSMNPSRPQTATRSSEQLPPGIHELESLYAPMKNLMHPLPNARKYSGHSMPLPHPLLDREQRGVAALPTYPAAYQGRRPSPPEEDEISVISVVNDIPPPLPPVQSHAVLQESLGHEIPRTPLLRTAQPHSSRNKLFKPVLDTSDWGKTPPLPPKRTSSKLSLLPPPAASSTSANNSPRPRHLSLDPNGSAGIYANTKSLLHRSSLMSTGSSENSSETSLQEEPHSGGLMLPMLSSSSNPGSVITTPTSEKSDLLDESSLGGGTNFSWPNYSVSSWGDQESSSSSKMLREREGRGSPLHISELEHRSVSQIGDAPEAPFAEPHSSTSSAIYVKPFPSAATATTKAHASQSSSATISSENHYMNLMYNALQRQGGNGSVESAMSPYIAMNNVRLLPNANVESISAIYATPQTLGRVKKTACDAEAKRTRSSSTSR